MDAKYVIVGTAGHIDHGKSSLVKALTGTDPDRWEEEKRRGITIDLGFAFLNLDGIQVGLVDVPGHERFVRNMLAGAGGIDLVLLVIAADESVMPQTREHFDICRLLGIPAGLIALTKSDLVEPQALELVKLEIEEFVRGSFLDGAAIVPVSASTGAGLGDLKEELSRRARSARAKDSDRHLRLPIDRSFAMKGFGTVVTGTLVSGTLATEDEVELYPTGRRVRVRGIQSEGESMPQAMAGQRTAVNLAGIEHGEIARGMVLGPPSIFRPTDLIDARITLLSSRAIENGMRLRFHQGTFEGSAEVVLLGREALGPGESAYGQIRLKEKTLLLPQDRFILRQLSPAITLGGGVVIDGKARRHRGRDATAAAEYLEILETGSREEILQTMAEAAPNGLSSQEIVARTGWSEIELGDVVEALAERQSLRVIAERPLLLASSQSVLNRVSLLRTTVEGYHRENPLLAGIPRQELRARAGNPRPELFETSLRDLREAGEVIVTGDIVCRAGRGVELTREEALAKKQIELEFERAGLVAPAFSEVIGKLGLEPGKGQELLHLLVREKTLIKVTGDMFFHQKALAELRGRIAEYRRVRGARVSVSAFKDLSGVTRKYAIPLLEYLDRERVTQRAGSERVIL